MCLAETGMVCPMHHAKGIAIRRVCFRNQPAKILLSNLSQEWLADSVLPVSGLTVAIHDGIDCGILLLGLATIVENICEIIARLSDREAVATGVACIPHQGSLAA
jgi:hypothetical protein